MKSRPLILLGWGAMADLKLCTETDRRRSFNPASYQLYCISCKNMLTNMTLKRQTHEEMKCCRCMTGGIEGTVMDCGYVPSPKTCEHAHELMFGLIYCIASCINNIMSTNWWEWSLRALTAALDRTGAHFIQGHTRLGDGNMESPIGHGQEDSFKHRLLPGFSRPYTTA